MIIETKYNIGDEVWAEFADVPMRCKVVDIMIIEEGQYIVAIYFISSIDERVFGTRKASKIFRTKDELLKSL